MELLWRVIPQLCQWTQNEIAAHPAGNNGELWNASVESSTSTLWTKSTTLYDSQTRHRHPATLFAEISATIRVASWKYDEFSANLPLFQDPWKFLDFGIFRMALILAHNCGSQLSTVSDRNIPPFHRGIILPSQKHCCAGVVSPIFLLRLLLWILTALAKNNTSVPSIRQ